MLPAQRLFRSFCLAAAMPALLLTQSFARGTDVSFKGTVVRIQTASTGTDTVTIRLIAFDLPVLVNADTDIESHGDSVGIAGLSPGDFVRVSGHYSPAGIVAKEIQILDSRTGTFRLRGPITSIAPAGNGVQVTVLGVQVMVPPEAQIERRGPQGGITIADLATGMDVDVRGEHTNDQLVAVRMKVGNREDDVVRVRFEGVIQAMPDSRLHVDTLGGGTAVVLLLPTTQTRGILAVGKLIEVKGILNAQLEVLASVIRVDGETDDTKRGDGKTEAESKIRLLPPAAGNAIRGEAKYKYMQRGIAAPEQEFEVEIEKAAPATLYTVRVTFKTSEMVEFGTLFTDSRGRARARFSSDPRGPERDISLFLPAGRNVRDMAKVQILLQDGTVVLEGVF